jgi:hypothetical protein
MTITEELCNLTELAFCTLARQIRKGYLREGFSLPVYATIMAEDPEPKKKQRAACPPTERQSIVGSQA